MAGQGRSRDASDPSRTPNQRNVSKRVVRAEAFAHAMEVAQRHGVFQSHRVGVSTSDALQACLDRSVALWEFCASRANELALTLVSTTDPDTGAVTEDYEGFFIDAPTPADPYRVVPNRWIVYERAARKDIEQLASDMVRLGIAERHVRVQEAQATLLAAAVRDAALSIGLPPDKVRELGEALRSRASELSSQVSPQDGSSYPRPPSLQPAPGGASSQPGHENAQHRPPSDASSRSQDSDTSRDVGKLGPGH